MFSKLDLAIKSNNGRNYREVFGFCNINSISCMFLYYWNARHVYAYFREQKAPNPIILGRINKLMQYCLWDWAELLDDWKVTS